MNSITLNKAIKANIGLFDAHNPEQIDTLDKISNGENLLITGAGGVGKSRFIVNLTKICQDNEISCRIVTPTGISAINLNDQLIFQGINPVASTYHSFYGFIPNSPDIKLKKDAKEYIKKLDLLIIDEGGMIDGLSFDIMSFKHSFPHKKTHGIRTNVSGGLFGREATFSTCFGKTQVLIFGDLFQLPPIVKEDMTLYGYPSNYIFDSVSYELGNFKEVSFYKNYRVKSFANEVDNKKADILRRLLKDVRYACLSDSSKHALGMLNKTRILSADAISTMLLETDAVMLSPRNAQCFRKNYQVKEKIKGEEILLEPNLSYKVGTYTKNMSIAETNVYLDKMFGNKELTFKVGQKVLITANGKGYYNGDMGILTGYTVFDNEVVSIEVTIERKDGPEAYNLNKQLISKPTPTEILKLANTNHLIKSPNAIEAYIKENVANWIEQFPVKDGFAITVHKAQGKTFETTIINPDGFGDSMFYVQLSRNTRLDGIFLTELIMQSHIHVDPYVLKWYLDKGLIEEYMEDDIRKKLNLTI
jgi:ATP-dependent DNA helicase PIF1